MRNRLRTDRKCAPTAGSHRPGRRDRRGCSVPNRSVFVTATPSWRSGCAMARQCHLNTCRPGIPPRQRTRPPTPSNPRHARSASSAYFTFIAEKRAASIGQRSACAGWRSDRPGRAAAARRTARDARREPAGICRPWLTTADAIGCRRRRHGRSQRAGPALFRSDAEISHKNGTGGGPRRPTRSCDRESPPHRWSRHRGRASRAHTGSARETRESRCVCGSAGSAGQSFGAFTLPRMHLQLEGEANDQRRQGAERRRNRDPAFPRRGLRDRRAESAITALYGATSGRLFGGRRRRRSLRGAGTPAPSR